MACLPVCQDALAISIDGLGGPCTRLAGYPVSVLKERGPPLIVPILCLASVNPALSEGERVGRGLNDLAALIPARVTHPYRRKPIPTGEYGKGPNLAIPYPGEIGPKLRTLVRLSQNFVQRRIGPGTHGLRP